MDCDHSGVADLQLDAVTEVATFNDRPGLLMFQTRVYCRACKMAFRFRHGGTIGGVPLRTQQLGDRPFVNVGATELCIRIEEAPDEPRQGQFDGSGWA